MIQLTLECRSPRGLCFGQPRPRLYDCALEAQNVAGERPLANRARHKSGFHRSLPEREMREAVKRRADGTDLEAGRSTEPDGGANRAAVYQVENGCYALDSFHWSANH